MLTSRFPEPCSYQSAARKLPMPSSSTPGFVGSYSPPQSSTPPRRSYCCPRSPPSSTMSLSEAPSSNASAAVGMTSSSTPTPTASPHVSITHRRLQQSMTSSSGVQLNSYSKTSFTTFLPPNNNNCNDDISTSSSGSSCDVTLNQSASSGPLQSHQLSVVSPSSFAQSQHPPLISTPLSPLSSPPPPPPPPMPSFVHHAYTIESSTPLPPPPPPTIVSQEQFVRQVEASSSSQTLPSSSPPSTTGRCSSVSCSPTQTVPHQAVLCFNGGITIVTSETKPAPVGLPPVPPPPPPPPPPLLPPTVSLPTSSSTPTLKSGGSFCCPRSKTRRLQWQKLTANRVLQAGRPNVWTHVVERLQKDLSVGAVTHQTAGTGTGDRVDGLDTHHLVDFETVERLFSIDLASSTSPRSASADSLSGDAPHGGQDRKRLADQIDVLDNRRSLNINIFLRQFRSSTSYDELISNLATADSEKIGAERLRTLVKTLPDDDEMNRVVNYGGDPSRLGLAERFCRDLASLSHYRLRIDALLMKEEFNQTIDFLKPMIDTVIITAKDLQKSQALRDILYTVLLIGNFLNAGGHAGDATGFRLQSLSGLSGIRANGGRLTLLNLIVSEVERHHPNIVSDLQSLKYLKEAAQFSVDSIAADISSLKQKLKTISNQLAGTDGEFQRQMNGFLEFACEEMSELETDVSELESLRRQLADYFCEDERSFKLDECIKLFARFFDSFVKASQENQERHLLEEKAEERRRQRAELMHAKQRSHQEVNAKTQKRRSDSIEGSSTVGNSSTTERSPTSVRQPREFDGVMHQSRRGSKTTSGNDDVNETANGNGGDCNDLFDILSRDAASNVLNYSSESLTRRKRRPRVADIGGTDTTTVLMGDRERTASPSPRNARASPSRDFERCGDGLIRRGSLPPAAAPVDGVVDEVGRPSSGHRRSRRSTEHRNASLHTVDREHCIRMARHIDYQQQQHQQPRTEVSSEEVSSVSVTSAVSVPDGGIAMACSGVSSLARETFQPQTVDEWSNYSRSSSGARRGDSPTAIKENSTVFFDLEQRDRSGIIGNDIREVFDNANVNCAGDAARTVDGMVSETPPVRRKSCLKNGGSVGPRFDELTGCTVASPGPINTMPASSSSSACRSTILFRQSSLDGTRSSPSRIESEAHLIDAAVLEFQTRQVPEREALKNRLRKLTQIYSNSTVPSDESGEVKTWPPRTSSDRCSGGRSSTGSVGSSASVYEVDFDEMTRNVAPFHSDSEGCFVRPDQSAVGGRDSSLRVTATTRIDYVDSRTTTGPLKSDSDSLSSQRDEGFESASLSSDLNLSSSQRSSMCDCDTTMVVSAFDGGIKDLDERSYDRVGGVRCVEDISRGSSQETETNVGQDPGLDDIRQVDGRNSAENYFARSSIDSLVTATHADVDDNTATDELQFFAPASRDDERNSVSPSDAGDGHSSSEHSSLSMTTSTKTAGSSRLRKPNSSATSSSPSKLKPKIPVRTSSSSVAKTGLSSTTSPVPSGRWLSTQQQQQQSKTVKHSPLTVASPSRRQSVDSDAVASSPLSRNTKTHQTRTKLSVGNASRTAARKQIAPETESHLAPPDERSRSDEHFVRSSVPRAAISAPALRANKKAAAEARTQLGRATTTTRTTSSMNGELPPPQQRNAKTIVCSSNMCVVPGVKEDITASKSTSRLPSRTQVNKGASSRIQPPNGSRIPPPPSKLQFR